MSYRISLQFQTKRLHGSLENTRKMFVDVSVSGKAKERTNCRAYITRFSELRHREISHFATRPPRLRGIEVARERDVPSAG